MSFHLPVARWNCYIDLLHVDDFIATLIEDCRAWYSSQHGDRFTLVIKRVLADLLGASAIIATKFRFMHSDGKEREIDLLVRAKGKLWAVEAKAYAKSREFWAGSFRATRLRLVIIADAVKQARETAQAVHSNRSSLPEEIRELEVEWVVCTPSQEFICPIDKYGMLTDSVPKVCTLEELAQHLDA